MIRAARIFIKSDTFDMDMDDYPTAKLGWALDRLSIGGKYHTFPIDRDPARPWSWSYEESMLPAVKKLLIAGEIDIIEQYSVSKES